MHPPCTTSDARWGSLPTTPDRTTPWVFHKPLPRSKCYTKNALHVAYAKANDTVSFEISHVLIGNNIAILYRYGPLVRQWAMRFEARHKFFKQLASRLGNFINITHTLAVRHQQMQCYERSVTTALPGEEVEIGPSDKIFCNSINKLYINSQPIAQVRNCMTVTIWEWKYWYSYELSVSRTMWVVLCDTVYTHTLHTKLIDSFQIQMDPLSWNSL